MHKRFALAAVLLLAACSPQSTTGAATSTAAAARFVVNDLGDNDGAIQGCTTMLGRKGAQPGADVFRAGGGDQDAQAFVRIDGALVTLNLTSANVNEQGGTRTFADASHTTQVVEALTTGATHEEADSVEQSGTLTITHNGSTQTIEVEGGTAC
ncbi:MAG TPA: hypothetical protein VG943_03230 [Caulobacterales bacterium]|nr:hypothetical protein [Caulobacterales bacterium]